MCVYMCIYTYMGDPGPRAPGRDHPCTTVPPPRGAAPGEAPGHKDELQRPQGRAPDRPRQPASAPKRAKMASRRATRPLTRPKRPARGFPRGPQEAKIVDFHLFFRCFLPSRFFGRPTLQDRPRGPQESSKTAQEGTKTAQESPKTAPQGPKRPPRGAPESPRSHPNRDKANRTIRT